MNEKAQVSLEYILISLSIVVVLSLIIIQATSLYSKNMQIIDNREIKSFSEKLQGNIDISEILENYSEEIQALPKKTWTIEKIDSKYKISNEEKEYFLESNIEIKVDFREIKKETILFRKENKKIYIEKK
ncbi:hypothetical protein GW835_03785 [archaeon]|nr:hypothetical protein [archaeon]NCP79659.1 hypothetical protein [archaeon]NCP97949.1 hypothetical protein [archaeon]NCQ07425.1 hypothetical protein [archaeon]NCQ51216.1 hypothetical protein [archaeon]